MKLIYMSNHHVYETQTGLSLIAGDWGLPPASRIHAGKQKNKKTSEGVYSGCVGISKNYRYVEWQWKVKQCINNKCVQERRRCSVKEDELHKRVPLLLKTKLASALPLLPPYMLRVWVSLLKFAFPLQMFSKNALPFHAQQQHVMYHTSNNNRAARLCCRRKFQGALRASRHFSWDAQA